MCVCFLWGKERRKVNIWIFVGSNRAMYCDDVVCCLKFLNVLPLGYCLWCEIWKEEDIYPWNIWRWRLEKSKPSKLSSRQLLELRWSLHVFLQLRLISNFVWIWCFPDVIKRNKKKMKTWDSIILLEAMINFADVIRFRIFSHLRFVCLESKIWWEIKFAQNYYLI